MTVIARSTFARGWIPDADAVNGPVDGLRRMDNCILDELGVVALRRGSARVATLAGLDVHSLYTALLLGVRHRLVGVDDQVLADGVALATGMAGIGEVHFGSQLGQVLFARGTSRYKWDGVTRRNWGLAVSGSAATVAASTPDGKVLASFDSAESPAFVQGEGSTALSFALSQDGVTANGALVHTPAIATNRGSFTKTFAAPTDFSVYTGGRVGDDSDLLSIWVFVAEPTHLLSVTLLIDVNAASANPFQTDYYLHAFVPGDETPLGPTDTTTLTPGLATGGPAGARVRSGAATGAAVPRSAFATTLPITNAGWSRLAVRRGDMTRIGSTTGKDWSTVKAVRVVVKMSSVTTLEFDTLELLANPVSGSYKYAYVLVDDTGTYVGKSGPSPLSALTQIQGAASITVPADALRDTQATAVWLFRFGGVLDGFYRVGVQAISGTGAVTFTDTLSDLDALIANIPLEVDNTVPPATILDIEGPFYDRTFVLTTDGFLWPSRRLNPDSFATGQVIRIAGADETPFWVKVAYGGLYVGTSKDIYRIEGDGAELPDGSVNFSKRPLNIDHPPINDGVTQAGNLLIYLADDAWRQFTGEVTASITAETSLLYRGQVRHGVGPVNLATGRFRAAFGHGQFVAITPEGSDAASSAVLYRHAPKMSSWYRHTYPQAFRSVYREPDGTLLAGDVAGGVWELDTGTSDAGTALPIVLWTKADDGGAPLQHKEPTDLYLTVDSGGAVLTTTLVRDEQGITGYAATVTTTVLDLAVLDIRALGRYRTAQLQLTGSCTRFRFGSYALNAVHRPADVKAFDSGPLDLGTRELVWMRGFRVKVNAIADLQIAVWLDGVVRVTVTAPITAGNADVVVPVDCGRNFVGRQPRLVITSASAFLPYWVEVLFRNTGRPSDKQTLRIPMAVGTTS